MSKAKVAAVSAAPAFLFGRLESTVSGPGWSASPRSNGNRRRSLVIPASGGNSVAEHRGWDAALSRHHGPRASVGRQNDHSPIPRLSGAISPRAVLRRVAQVVFDAFNGEVVAVPRGHRPVSERNELCPLGANSDPSRTVIAVGLGSRIAAARVHVLPSRVKTATAHGMFGRPGANGRPRARAAAPSSRAVNSASYIARPATLRSVAYRRSMRAPGTA